MKRLMIKIKAWLLTPVPRWRSITLTVAFIATMTVLLLYGGDKIFAATYTFTQTNWSGGANANNASHTSNQTGWTEFSAKDANLSVVNSGADLQLSLTSTINEYTIGALANLTPTVTGVTDNSNNTWTVSFSGSPNFSRIFKNDKFTDSAAKAWKILSVSDSLDKLIVIDSEGNGGSPAGSGTGTVGRWYASISAWEAGRQGDITATGRNVIERGLLYYDGSADATAVTIDGWTTDATHYVEIYVPLSERHRGVWDAGKYNLNNLITIDEDFVRVNGLQIGASGTGSTAWITISSAVSVTSSEIHIANNIIKATSVSGSNNRGIKIDGGKANKIYNNIIYDFSGATDYGINDTNNVASISYVYNNTLNNCANGIIRSQSSPTFIVKNNIAQSATDGYSQEGAGSDYNISNVASDASGANSKNSTTVSFVDATNDDFHIAFNDTAAKDSGTDLSADSNLAFTTDIDNDTRTGTWDIGADDVGATLVKVHSIGTASRNFSTLQSWEDARDGVLTTRNVFKITAQSAAFTEGETITGTSGATGTYIKERDTPSASETYMTVDKGNATAFVAGDTLTGGTSGKTATLSTILTASGTIEKGEAYKDSVFNLTSDFTIAGSTVDSSHYMWITVAPSNRHNGTFDKGAKITIGGDYVDAFVVANKYTIVEWFLVDGTGYARSNGVQGSTQFTARNNIFYNLRIPVAGNGVIQSTESFFGNVYNNIIYRNANNDATHGFQINNYISANIYNNIVYNYNTAYKADGPTGTVSVQNNIAVNNTADYNSSGFDTSSNNISSDATASGVGSLTSQTLSDIDFVSTTAGMEDFHILPTSVAKDAGTSLSSAFTTDIDNQTRPYDSAWDIGADEWVSSTVAYPSSQTLTSSPYDSTDAANVIGSLVWTEDASLPAGTTVTVSLRTASTSGGLTSSSWGDFTNATANCTKTTGTVTCPLSAIPAGLKDGTDDQWVQYKVTLTSTGASTPTVSDITIQYVVNAPPEFNPTGGLVISQITDSADANFGKVSIAYSVRDSDTSSGTADPGYVTPSFQYNIGSGFVAINSAKLSTDATLHKAVDGVAYTAYTAYWDAQTDIPTNYLTTAQIKVILNDQEAANNTVSSTSSDFTLDTKVPTGSLKADASGNTLTLTSADDTNLQYILSNNADLTADGVNATSGIWTSAGSNSVSITPAWTINFSSYYPTVYGSVRDTAGNITAFTTVGPIVPTNMFIQDISNVSADTYKEFVSWEPYVAPASGAVFSQYEVYRSTDGSTYGAAVSTIADAAINYYVDQTVVNGTHYYYKIRTIDSDTDKSSYSSVVDDIVDGQGGSDTTAPSITSVTVAEQQATYATITWTTDEISNSEVDYSISPSTAFGTAVTSASYVTSHSVTITGLTPNTTYLFRVKSTDVLGNAATNDNSGAGFTIITIGGPIISNVTETEVNEHSATIFWNTNTDSDSYVSYSTNSGLSNPTRFGSASLVGGPPYQHKVSISGLAAGTKYYYFVESTDASSNNSKDTNGNNYYSFVTTSDTKAPVISEVSAPVSSLTAAVIVWSTDERATGIVDYGTASGNYLSSTTLNSTLTVFHIGSLSGLTENTKYYYRVRSSDDAGNEATSAEYNFTSDKTNVVVVGGGGPAAPAPAVVLDTAPPAIANIKTEDIKSFSATVSFNTNEDSVGFVNYGADSANLNMASGDSSYSQNHKIKLSGLTMGKKYSFIVKAIDKSGNIATSPIGDFTTTFFTESLIQLKDTEAFQKEIEDAIESALPSLVPPFIEKPIISDITEDSATITFRTNIKSYPIANYTTDANYDKTKENPYDAEISDMTAKDVSHTLSMIGLKSNTKYHVMAKAFSLPEVVGKSKDLTFITEALKIKANIGDITNNSFKAFWTTSEPATSIAEYRNMKTGELNQKTSDVKTKAHEILVDNLTPGTSYSVNVFGYNEKGNKISIASSIIIKTSIDTTAPKITSLTIDSALIPGRNDRAQTIVSWKTDEPSTSAVFFKEGASLPNEKLTNKVEMKNNFVIDHAIVVSSLKPGELYSIQVSSTDAAGNTALFPIRTAVVPQQSESVIEIIFKNFEDTFRFLKR